MPLITADLARYLGYLEMVPNQALFAIGGHFHTVYNVLTCAYAQELAEEDLHDQPFALNIDESSDPLDLAAIRLQMAATIHGCWLQNCVVDQDDATGRIDDMDLDRWLASQIRNGPFYLPKLVTVSGDAL